MPKVKKVNKIFEKILSILISTFSVAKFTTVLKKAVFPIAKKPIKKVIIATIK